MKKVKHFSDEEKKRLEILVKEGATKAIERAKAGGPFPDTIRPVDLIRVYDLNVPDDEDGN